jgi:hypothetical protein
MLVVAFAGFVIVAKHADIVGNQRQTTFEIVPLVRTAFGTRQIVISTKQVWPTIKRF